MRATVTRHTVQVSLCICYQIAFRRGAIGGRACERVQNRLVPLGIKAKNCASRIRSASLGSAINISTAVQNDAGGGVGAIGAAKFVQEGEGLALRRQRRKTTHDSRHENRYSQEHYQPLISPFFR